MNETLCPRRAYAVKRYHTWPVIRQQTVGEHSANVWRILRAIWPEAPAHMLDHAMIHDMGEVVTGDLPYPVKAQNRDLKLYTERLEYDAQLALTEVWAVPAPTRVAEEESEAFKLAHAIEMWEFALDELLLGNKCATIIASRMSTKMTTQSLRVPSAIGDRAAKYIHTRSRYYQMVNEQEIS